MKAVSDGLLFSTNTLPLFQASFIFLYFNRNVAQIFFSLTQVLFFLMHTHYHALPYPKTKKRKL